LTKASGSEHKIKEPTPIATATSEDSLPYPQTAQALYSQCFYVYVAELAQKSKRSMTFIRERLLLVFS
jgi:hypothetical protein